MTYIYIMKRKGRGAVLSLALPTFEAKKIEEKVFARFSHYRITLTPRKREGFVRQHIKVGISNNPRRRVEQVDGDLFGSGRTEWLQAGPLVRFAVYLFVFCAWFWSWLWLLLLYVVAVFFVSLWLIS